jgi:serine protease Do
VKLEVVRDGKEKSISVKLAPRPDEQESISRGAGQSGGEKESGDVLGLSVEDLTPQLAQRAQVPPTTKGAIIVDVAPDSPAAEAGLEAGDVVAELNKQPVASAADYRKVVKGLKKGDSALLRVKHGQATQYVPVRVK